MNNIITARYKKIVILQYENNKITDYCILEEEKLNV